MRINNRLTLYVVLMGLLVIASHLLPYSIAQEQNQNQLSQAGYNAALSFFWLDENSYKFNGIGLNSEGFIVDPTIPYGSFPLDVTNSPPYKLEIINKGTIQQMVNGSMYTIFAHELWYYYTISLVTMADATIIKVPQYTISDWLYHSGWGFDPWGIGQWMRADIHFKSYNLSAQFPSVEDGMPTSAPYELDALRYQGKLTYELHISPEFAFPQNVTVIDGKWVYDGIYYGFIRSEFLYAERGMAQDFDVQIDGVAVTASESPMADEQPSLSGDEAELIGGEYYKGDNTAFYRGLEPKVVNSPADIKPPANGTMLAMRSLEQGRQVIQTSTFDTTVTALSFLREQQHVSVEVRGLRLKPEIKIVGGVHKYRKVDYYAGLVDMFPPFGVWVGGHTDVSDETRSVVLGWDVWNVYQILHIKTGIRVLSLYEWNPAVLNDTLGEPQGKPDWYTGDRLLNTGIEGSVHAETILNNLPIWLLLIVAAVAVVIFFIWKRGFGGGRGKQTVEIKQYFGEGGTPQHAE